MTVQFCNKTLLTRATERSDETGHVVKETRVYIYIFSLGNRVGIPSASGLPLDQFDILSRSATSWTAVAIFSSLAVLGHPGGANLPTDVLIHKDHRRGTRKRERHTHTHTYTSEERMRGMPRTGKSSWVIIKHPLGAGGQT